MNPSFQTAHPKGDLKMNKLPKLIVVAGTTASGKSDLGVDLANAFNGEVVSADSRQVFRGLDLGSGKITPEETQGIPHHMIDICNPGDFFSVHDFQRLAYPVIDDIIARGKLPILVGGTGLYVASITEGYDMSDSQPDLAYRDELEKLTTPQLYALLMEKAPDSDIDPRNRNRVMRKLEKIQAGDDHEPQNNPRYDCLKLGVHFERPLLKERIDERLVRRMQMGMVDEVRSLIENGARIEFLLKLGLEYRFITQYIIGEIATEEEMCAQLSLAIKRFAKRQMIWFRRDKEIQWLDMHADPFGEACALIRDFLQS